MKICKLLQISIDFSTNFLIFSLASGDSALEPSKNLYFQSFLKFPLNFRENYDKNIKKISKIAKFPLKFSTSINFSLLF